MRHAGAPSAVALLSGRVQGSPSRRALIAAPRPANRLASASEGAGLGARDAPLVTGFAEHPHLPASRTAKETKRRVHGLAFQHSDRVVQSLVPATRANKNGDEIWG
jgi:hypothetical protein